MIKIFKSLLNVGLVIIFTLMVILKSDIIAISLRIIDIQHLENVIINVKLYHETHVVFHNLKNYNFHLIVQELDQLSLKIMSFQIE